MKKLIIPAFMAAAVLMSSCGAGTLGVIAGSQTGSKVLDRMGAGVAGSAGDAVAGLITSVLGLDKMTKQQLIGTWRYSQPGCAFTSSDLLSKAGGEVVAAQIKQKLATPYQTVGLSSANTQMTFNQDGTFTATIAGKNISGKYTFDEANYKLTMQTLLFSFTAYTKRNANGIAILFEASKLLTLMQTLSAMSGNQTLQTVGDLSKNYDGLRIGFDMTK